MKAEVEDVTARTEDPLKRLAGIAGLDLDRGLDLMRGNVQKYTKLLILLSEEYKKHAQRMAEMLNANDLKSIEPIAQALRGSSGMLGAVKVSNAASAVLSAMNSDGAAGEIRRLSAVLIDELSSLVEGIHSAVMDCSGER